MMLWDAAALVGLGLEQGGRELEDLPVTSCYSK